MTNDELFDLCKKYGAQAQLWRRKFVGLLPEVFRRRVYLEKGYGSIFEFAAKLGGVSVEQVRLALNLERRFDDKPELKKLLVEGEVSINKLARVASIASAENHGELAGAVRVLPMLALDTLVRDERKTTGTSNALNTSSTLGAGSDDGNTDSVNKGAAGEMDLDEKRAADCDYNERTNRIVSPVQRALFNNDGLCAQTLEFEIDRDVLAELNELHGKGIDVNGLLREMLERRKVEIAEEKEQIAADIGMAKSRYVPVKVLRVLTREHGTRCSAPGCGKLAVQNHHTNRFGISRNHDPRFMAPFCKGHHIIAHLGDLKFQRVRTDLLISS